MKSLLKLLPFAFLALFAAELIAVFGPKRDGQFHLREFGALPVLMNGRVQPFDSVGRNTLLQIRSTGDVPLEEVPAWKFWHHPKKLKSSEWLAEVLFRPDVADTRPIFLIHHPDLLAELNLRDKGVAHSLLRYYTWEELKPVLPEIEKQGEAAWKVNEKQRTPFQEQAAKLNNAIILYQFMKAAARPPAWDDFQQTLADLETNMPAGIAAIRAQQAGESFDKEALDRFLAPLQSVVRLADDKNAGQMYPLVVPPADPEHKRDNWTSMAQGILESLHSREISAPIRSFAAMAGGFAEQDASGFNNAVSAYKHWLQKDFPAELKKGGDEFFYNQSQAFLHSIIIYIFVFILAAFSLLMLSITPQLSESLRKSAFYLMILAGLVHTFGLVFRMYLEGRPPVTNLYSSAVFIGWGTMVLGLVLERIYRVGIGCIIGSLAGFVTLFIAQSLALGGDTMPMMQAVLDTNFWLATHVVVVTLGYASTFVAGLLAILYILLGLVTPLLSRPLSPATASSAPVSSKRADISSLSPSEGERAGVRPRNAVVAAVKAPPGKPAVLISIGKALAKMVYGIVCFATLFSFTGTVLGGIWADQSWGRFWGWDPKENGALLIVLWNALILHARWGGLVRERGLMNLAVFGNIMTSFSWFGVNMLGVGLHSYGWMAGAFFWLAGFIASQILIIALGLLPLNWWRSFQPARPATPLGQLAPQAAR